MVRETARIVEDVKTRVAIIRDANVSAISCNSDVVQVGTFVAEPGLTASMASTEIDTYTTGGPAAMSLYLKTAFAKDDVLRPGRYRVVLTFQRIESSDK
jgi:hypothetical protein